jgi:hypothetical protein
MAYLLHLLLQTISRGGAVDNGLFTIPKFENFLLDFSLYLGQIRFIMEDLLKELGNHMEKMVRIHISELSYHLYIIRKKQDGRKSAEFKNKENYHV